MTSDAKIGLLLGLVFIFIIAVLINGLPSFKGSDNNNDLTMTSVGAKNNNLGIADNERKVSRQFIDQEIRLNAPLPQGSAVSTTTVKENSGLVVGTASDTAGNGSLVKAGNASESANAQNTTNKALERSLKEVASQLDSVSVETSTVRTIEATSTDSVSQKIYVVNKGDSLAVIAQKVYGPLEGKKQTNIMKIFKANTSVLESPDEIYVGQKLVIPLLSSSAESSKLKTVGGSVMAATNNVKQTNVYVVKEGDSLWTIAVEKLGNGSRYTEILQLNKNILADESTLVIGMRLKLPER